MHSIILSDCTLDVISRQIGFYPYCPSGISLYNVNIILDFLIQDHFSYLFLEIYESNLSYKKAQICKMKK